MPKHSRVDEVSGEEGDEEDRQWGGSTQPVTQVAARPNEIDPAMPPPSQKRVRRRPQRLADDQLAAATQDDSDPEFDADTTAVAGGDGDETGVIIDPSVRASETMNADGFRAGSIVRARFENFLTYDLVELLPGPRMNVIIGPNGTGKSAVACGIALGLAAKTQVLGRGKEPKEFVKHGCARAVIELELCGGARGAPNVVVRREIKNNGPCQFYLNGKACTAKDVTRRCQQLRVQLDNLCQFLPQDRVADFARLTPYQLLEETEKAVGPTNMLEMHKELAKLKAEEKTSQRDLEAKQQTLREMMEANAKLQGQVDRFKERQKMLERLRMLTGKRLWMLFEASRLKALAIQETMKAAQDARKGAEATWNRSAVAAKEQKEKTVALLERNTKAKAELKQMEATKQRMTTTLADLEAEEMQNFEDIKNLRSRAAEREGMIRRVEEELARLQQALEALPDLSELKARVDSQNERAAKVAEELLNVEQQKRDLDSKERAIVGRIRDLQKRLSDLNDEKKRREAQLEREARDVYSAYTWLHHNKGLFTAQVFGPLLLECMVANKDYANYLEIQAGKQYLYSFLAQNKADQDRLITELCERQNIKVNVLCVNPSRLPPAAGDLEPLRRLGITSRLVDVLRAPTPVVTVLCDFCNIHLALIGTDEVVKHVDSLPLGITYAPSVVYKRVQSRYEDRQISTQQTNVRPARLLSPVNLEEKARCEEDLRLATLELAAVREARAPLDSRGKELLMEKSSLQNSMAEFVAAKRERDTLARRVAQKGKELEGIRTQEDARGEEEKLRRKGHAIVLRKADLVMKLADETSKAAVAQIALAEPTVRYTAFRRQQDRLMEEARKGKTEFDKADAALKEATAAFEDAKRETATLKSNASNEAPLTDELKRFIKEERLTLEQIDGEIGVVRTQIDLNLYTNPKVIEEYETRKKEIAEKQTAVEMDSDALNSKRDRIDELRSRWLPPLKEIVAKIDTSFNSFMREIKCSGSVRLTESSDYDKFSIDIMVKFGENKPEHQLTGTFQSGGEKSVATMLYIISLQDHTECPFRLVDEINQGMDPKNERMIFRQVTRAASRPGLPQCFMITPKLLPDLDYTEDMTVHCVMNGPWLGLSPEQASSHHR